MKNKASAVSVIGGADGPTSVFLLGKNNGQKLPLRQRWKQNRYRYRRKKVEASVVANPHTLDEVIYYMQKKYSAREISQESRRYREEYQSLKASLILKYNPEILGCPIEINPPKDLDETSLQEYMEKVNERIEKAGQVSDELFPMDFHIYEMIFEGNGDIHFIIEKNWAVLSGGYSGKGKAVKKLAKISRDIYQYYGVTEEDIKTKSERYSLLITVLASEN